MKLSKKSKENIFNIFFSRTFIIIILLMIQLIYMFYILKILEEYIYWGLGGNFLISFFMIIYLTNNRQNPSVKFLWAVLILVLPIFSTLLYFYFSSDLGNRILNRKMNQIIKNSKKYRKQDEETLNELKNDNKEMYNIFRYINKYAYHNVYRNKEIKYYPLGEDKFKDLLIELKNAKKYIFMEYFIISKGYMWDSILEILKEKVKEGVEVRILYDGTCAFSMLPYSYPKELEKYGIKVKMFSPIKPFISTHYNNRDHRKITIIDSKVAFNGGINIGDEYINKIERFGHWKDTAIKIKGEVVKEYIIMFLEMWNVSEKYSENFNNYLEDVEIDKGNDGYVIAYGETPSDDELLAEKIYIDMINNAKDYVYIMTPYFVTDYEFINSLTDAAKKGIETVLIMPHICDKEIPFAIAHTYYLELLDAGVKIYEYKPGFIHAKMFITDDIKAIVGTINLDYRSLYHHYECATYIYKSKIIKQIKDDFINTINQSILITKEKLKKDKLTRKILGRLLKIFSPLI